MNIIADGRRWVIKLGSGILVRHTELDQEFLAELATQIKELRSAGRQAVIVTSGAIATGLALLKLEKRPRSIAKKQAVAAVGQIALMHAYRAAFARQGLAVAQMLLTHEDLDHRKRFLNARRTLQALTAMGVIPLINENDTVASEEIRVGDNDNLAAMVACLWEADLLVLLSDIDGLYTADPHLHPEARLIPVVRALDEHIEAYAAPSTGPTGIGGMRTKLEAARRAAEFQIPTIIAQGREHKLLSRLLRGERLGTVIWPPGGERLPARKHWIAYTLKPQGTVLIDQGARRAIVQEGKSLLPSGIVNVAGDFDLGEAVVIADEGGKALARGLVGYSAREITRIEGHRSGEIERILGYRYQDEVIHRDDLVIL